MAAWELHGTRPCGPVARSEEHTSELQSLTNLVCRLLLEKKKNSDLRRLAARVSATSRTFWRAMAAWSATLRARAVWLREAAGTAVQTSSRNPCQSGPRTI